MPCTAFTAPFNVNFDPPFTDPPFTDPAPLFALPGRDLFVPSPLFLSNEGLFELDFEPDRDFVVVVTERCSWMALARSWGGGRGGEEVGERWD